MSEASSPAEDFGKTSGGGGGGETVHRITLSNGVLTASLLSYGGILQDLRLAGHNHPLVLGFENLAAYENEDGDIGATVGRVAGRIAHGQFALDGHTFHLDRNFLGRHTLHGGSHGTAKQIWQIVSQDSRHVTFGLDLEDGHMGFPGRLRIELEWRLTETATLRATIRAETDTPTLCNLAQHSYFNLTGRRDMTGHRLTIDSDHYLPLDDDLIPTGEVRSVDGTRFDFRKPMALPFDMPVDHNFCLAAQRRPIQPVARLAAEDTAKDSLALEIRTTEPGLQVYDGAGLATKSLGLGGFAYGARAGLALEPQLWPDAPHHKHFPNAVLHPGETYLQKTEFSFTP